MNDHWPLFVQVGHRQSDLIEYLKFPFPVDFDLIQEPIHRSVLHVFRGRDHIVVNQTGRGTVSQCLDDANSGVHWLPPSTVSDSFLIPKTLIAF